jgi:hypothetical protein
MSSLRATTSPTVGAEPEEQATIESSKAEVANNRKEADRWREIGMGATYWPGG